MGFFSKPKIPDPPQAPDPVDLDAQAEAEAAEEAKRLRKNRVNTILTSGQGLQDETNVKRLESVLGG